MFINKVLNPNSDNATLINPETMRTEITRINIKKRDDWLSTDGINNAINKLKGRDVISSPVKIDNRYLMLVYDNEKEITVYKDTSDIPEDIDKSKLRPITYAEMFYISLYDVRKKYPAFITRYPITGLGIENIKSFRS